VLAAQTPGPNHQHQITSTKSPANEAAAMLGRHVYRVHPAEDRWTITKEGESHTRGEYGNRDEAIAEACRLADSDKPSRVLVDDGDGLILEERLFGSDLSQELDPT
jgi:Uncharacterized protein conserved in bacteria (DUF2188)